MSEKISLLGANGKRVSGRFETEGGIVIVRVSDGRVAKADSMLHPKPLAKVLLLQLH
jgi:hypothetical protein